MESWEVLEGNFATRLETHKGSADFLALAERASSTKRAGETAPPPFDENANGTPHQWKMAQSVVLSPSARIKFGWKREARTPDAADFQLLCESFGRVLQFFRMRPGLDGVPVAEKLPDRLLTDESSWFALDWKPFLDAGGVNSLPSRSGGQCATQGLAEWETAWHGCNFEALYSAACGEPCHRLEPMGMMMAVIRMIW